MTPLTYFVSDVPAARAAFRAAVVRICCTVTLNQEQIRYGQRRAGFDVTGTAPGSTTAAYLEGYADALNRVYPCPANSPAPVPATNPYGPQ
jgi:hypothetical protein